MHGGECIRIVGTELPLDTYVCNRCDGNCNDCKSHVSRFTFQVLSFRLSASLELEADPETLEPDTRNSGSKGERRATEPVAAADSAIAEEGFMSSGGLDSQPSNDSVASVAPGAQEGRRPPQSFDTQTDGGD